ncbi:uncharacterized protein LOC109715173 [Ananas comosus]|uniref:Uncharacterized protein LOC109715173 n=1 Tax=Ananas comosus TaxID=4615 RepID=A0A6P5FRF7_ANACO|nr:uncharacterized protein LOC109715173 [Ananas comosus]
MASPPTSSSSSAGLFRRAPGSARAHSAPPEAVGAGAIRADVDPPPRPKPIMQKLAIGAIVLLGCVQFFLPASHFRDPSDPRRTWIPYDPSRSSPISTNKRSFEEEQLDMPVKQEAEVPGTHIFSWTDCLDLRVLAVLANSTLSSSRYPEDVFFHFFIPEHEDEKLSFYKLKVVLPSSNLGIIGQKDVKEKLNIATPEAEFLWNYRHELAPFFISYQHLPLNKYVYVLPDTIIKGNIEDLFSFDLAPYAIGAAEDCSKRVGDYVDIEVLNAIQRTAAKSWISDKPYDKNACLPDFNVLLVEPHKLESTLLESIVWWNKVLDKGSERGNRMKFAIALAFYDKYFKLPSTWKISSSLEADETNEIKALRFDGPTRVCSEDDDRDQGPNHGDIWQQYLSSNSVAVLSH